MNGKLSHATIRSAAIAVASLTLAACAHAPVVHPASVRHVRRVAIVALTGRLRLLPEVGVGPFGMIRSVQNITTLANGSRHAAREAQAEGTYDVVAKRLHDDLGWTVLPRHVVQSNPTYARAFRDVVNPDGRGQSRNSGDKFTPLGIIDFRRADRLSSSDRRDIAKALGVQGLVFVRLDFDKGKRNPKRRHDRFPKAIVHFALYDATAVDPIWTDGDAEGATAMGNGKGVRSTMGFRQTKRLTQLVEQAADLGMKALLQRYRSAAQQAAAKAAAAHAAPAQAASASAAATPYR